jgi:hypothetical protein
MEKLPFEQRESGLSKIVGGDEKQREEIRKFFEIHFKYGDWAEISYEKRQEEEQIIRAILEYMDEFVRRYGGIPVKVKSFHINLIDKSRVKPEVLTKLTIDHGVLASYEFSAQQIAIFEYLPGSDSLLKLAHLVTHELIHFNSFQSVTASHEVGILARQRRGGLSVLTKEGESYFRLLNEAVVTELQIRFAEEYFHRIPELEDEIKNLEELKRKLPRDQQSECAYLEQNGEVIGYYPYFEERKKLNALIDDIFQRNKGSFKSREDIFYMFAKAVMTGELLPIARLIEKTYGKGSFRKLGEETK